MPAPFTNKKHTEWAKSSGGNTIAADLKNNPLAIVENAKRSLDNESVIGSVDQAKPALSGTEKSNLGL